MSHQEVAWFYSQQMDPECIAIESHLEDPCSAHYAYVFENPDYVVKQYAGWSSRLTIEDHWSGEVLAEAPTWQHEKPAICAEQMLQNAHGNHIIKKKVVEQIIYKIMLGDMHLMDDDEDMF